MLHKILLTMLLTLLPMAAYAAPNLTAAAANSASTAKITAPAATAANKTELAAPQRSTVAPPPPRVRTNRANTPWGRRTAINQRRTERRVERTADQQLERTRDMQRQQDNERRERNK